MEGYLRYQIKQWDYFIGVETVVISCICFGNVFFIMLLIPFILNRKKVYQNKLRRKQVNQLREAFIQQISYLSSSLYAGYSMENSILLYAKRIKEIPSIEPQYETFIEYESMVLKQGGGTPLYFRRMKNTFKLPEISSFCEAIEIGYQMGGQIAPVFKEAVVMTKAYYHTEKDLEAMIAEKRLEASIISWMPYGIILFLRLSMGDLMEPIFKTMMGIAFLQVLICVFEVSSWATQKICDFNFSYANESC